MWQNDDVRARAVVRLGSIVLTTQQLARPDPDLVAAAVAAGLRTHGLSLLSWGREVVALRDRLAFCRAALGEPWPAVDDDALLMDLPQWLGPALAKVRRRADWPCASRRRSGGPAHPSSPAAGSPWCGTCCRRPGARPP